MSKRKVSLIVITLLIGGVLFFIRNEYPIKVTVTKEEILVRNNSDQELYLSVTDCSVGNFQPPGTDFYLKSKVVHHISKRLFAGHWIEIRQGYDYIPIFRVKL